MGKTIRISNEAHKAARDRAKKAGVKLHRFVEAAIEAFVPVFTLTPSRKTKRAG